MSATSDTLLATLTAQVAQILAMPTIRRQSIGIDGICGGYNDVAAAMATTITDLEAEIVVIETP